MVTIDTSGERFYLTVGPGLCVGMVLELVKKFVFRPDDVGEVQVRDASPGTRLAVVTLRTRNLAKLVRSSPVTSLSLRAAVRGWYGL